MKGEYLLIMSTELKIDEIGYWSEIKLSILDDYAKPYNQILRAHNLKTIYIDAFAGAGHHRAKGSNRIIDGSPLRALNVQPPFDILHFVDINTARVDQLGKLVKGRANVMVHRGDCNHILLAEILPRISYENYERALCILDPYGLQLDWEVIRTAGHSRVTEIFLNFPVMDMNMNVFWANPDRVAPASQQRMTRFWGDESWREAAYEPIQGLFGAMTEKNPIDDVVKAFQERLKKVAGFQYVPKPMPMRNSKKAIVYFLFFAAQKPVAQDIVRDIFNKYAPHEEVPNG
jgi:three-Cys-motif partner protein